jgi:hypothetical protein
MNETFNYNDTKGMSILRALKPAFNKGTLYIRADDHKIGMNTGLMWNTPWVHSGGNSPTDRNCVLFHGLILPYFNFIPAKCQQCWKVVARPNTVAQLFKLCELQQASDRDSKAGIEIRPSVAGNYGAYWYNDSIEEGEECRQFVRSLCDEYLDKDVTVFLKRGCTEFEHKFGNSNEWKVTEGSREAERMVTDAVVIDGYEDRSQPDYLIDDIKLKWIEFAYERGDMTYKEFTDGKPLYPAYVKYESNPEFSEEK